MRELGRRLMISAAAAVAPMAFVTIAVPAVSSADCQDTEWWDPGTNQCRPLTVPNCGDGNWWDPAGNQCRPLVNQPLACDFGSYWDPVANVCRTVFVLPPQ